MPETSPAPEEIARIFVGEADASSRSGRAPDCAEQMAAIHAEHEAECARLKRERLAGATRARGYGT